MYIMPIKDMKNAAKISEICRETGEAVYITKNGYADMVIMNANIYEARMARIDAYEKVMEGIHDVENGKTMDAIKAIKEIGAKYGL